MSFSNLVPSANLTEVIFSPLSAPGVYQSLTPACCPHPKLSGSIPCSKTFIISEPFISIVTKVLSNGSIVYISPTVIVPTINGALTPPPLVIAISASTILLIVSATVAPIGLTPVSLSCGKSTDKSATFSFIIGAKSASNFANISSIFLSTGRVSFLLEISSSLVVTTNSSL